MPATATPLEIPSPQKVMGASAPERLVVVPDLSEFTKRPDTEHFRWSAGLLQEFFAWTKLTQSPAPGTRHDLVIAAPKLHLRALTEENFLSSFREYVSLLFDVNIRIVFNRPQPACLTHEQLFASSHSDRPSTTSVVHVYTREYFNEYKALRGGSRFHREAWLDILERYFGDDAFQDWQPLLDRSLVEHLAAGEIQVNPENDAAPKEILLLSHHHDKLKTSPRGFIVPRQG